MFLPAVNTLMYERGPVNTLSGCLGVFSHSLVETLKL